MNRTAPKVAICTDWSSQIPRNPDGSAFSSIFTGGLRATQYERERWDVAPILEGRVPHIKGYFSTRELHGFLRQYGLTFIAFSQVGWSRGAFHSTWMPWTPGKTDHSVSPADTWSSIAGNLYRLRAAAEPPNSEPNTHDSIANLVDARTDPERLSSAISLSLRSIDLSVEAIADYYHEQLVNLMAAGSTNGELVATTLDQNLFAHVNSFLMHFGSARDYLATLCASRIGMDSRIDSLARLVDSLRSDHLDKDPILAVFTTLGYIKPKASPSTKFEVSGWMQQATELRNEFMHRRPFGAKFHERTGSARTLDSEIGVYRYVRPIVVTDAKYDLLDLIAKHYRKIGELFDKAATATGYDAEIPTFTDVDIISIKQL
ncbi:hypothetical protein [Mesorhizobium sp. CA7]|uniref:hypothetical protein n=1 Tax=Mesorhizobium sp. CA7 TaxID=588501 RepID=UPI001CCBB092|nr:hypothetical protein [Mesorhizobium sp. CA7]MBZ9815749.1 hypothetical protein [Mesorhizobium sp. CA7]